MMLRERERERERSRTKIEDYHFINSFNQLLRIAMDKGIAWGLTRKERRENKRRSGFRERERERERERLRCVWRCSVSPSSTNSEQICLSLFWVLIMEASVLGGQHGSKKTMGNTTSPSCVCCETQIGGGGCGFLPHHSPPLATIKVAFLISPSISSFLGLGSKKEAPSG